MLVKLYQTSKSINNILGERVAHKCIVGRLTLFPIVSNSRDLKRFLRKTLSTNNMRQLLTLCEAMPRMIIGIQPLVPADDRDAAAADVCFAVHFDDGIVRRVNDKDDQNDDDNDDTDRLTEDGLNKKRRLHNDQDMMVASSVDGTTTNV